LFKNFEEKNVNVVKEIQKRNSLKMEPEKPNEIKFKKGKVEEKVNQDKVRIIMDHKIIKTSNFEDYPEDSFCEAFFTVGLNPKETNIILRSENFSSSCRHKDCSKMPSYKASLIDRLPYKDNKKFELNSVVNK